MQLKDIIKSRRKELNLTLADIAKACSVSEATASRWESGEIGDMKRSRIAALSKILKLSPSVIVGTVEDEESLTATHQGGESQSYLGEPSNVVPDPSFLVSPTVAIPVYGSVPAGIPVEAIQDIDGYVDIPEDWASHGRYIGLTVSGASMYPKYLEGDIVVIKIQPEASTGQDAVVYVNGYDATLKTVVNESDGSTTLRPINPEYQTKTYAPGVVRVLGVVKRLVREF